jgi:hypothetical protein
MSSTEFSTELRPDKRLRKLVVLSGAICGIAGLSLVIHMPIGVLLRIVLAAIWLSWCIFEVSVLTRAWIRTSRIRISQSGQIWVTDAAGQRLRVSLLRGSVVGNRYAWLRIRFEDGRKSAELVGGNAVKDGQWHRFQLIWKQSRQTIGRVERS